MLRKVVIAAIAVLGPIGLAGVPPVHALTMKECSAKYQAAQPLLG
jgi:hypothetical protein